MTAHPERLGPDGREPSTGTQDGAEIIRLRPRSDGQVGDDDVAIVDGSPEPTDDGRGDTLNDPTPADDDTTDDDTTDDDTADRRRRPIATTPTPPTTDTTDDDTTDDDTADRDEAHHDTDTADHDTTDHDTADHDTDSAAETAHRDTADLDDPAEADDDTTDAESPDADEAAVARSRSTPPGADTDDPDGPELTEVPAAGSGAEGSTNEAIAGLDVAIPPEARAIRLDDQRQGRRPAGLDDGLMTLAHRHWQIVVTVVTVLLLAVVVVYAVRGLVPTGSDGRTSTSTSTDIAP